MIPPYNIIPSTTSLSRSYFPPIDPTTACEEEICLISDQLTVEYLGAKEGSKCLIIVHFVTAKCFAY
jgi:hypothetical protein